MLRKLGHEPRIVPAKYSKPFVKGQKDDYNDAEAIASEIEKIAAEEASCQRLMSGPDVGPIISTAMVAAVGDGEAFERGRDFGAWLGLVHLKFPHS